MIVTQEGDEDSHGNLHTTGSPILLGPFETLAEANEAPTEYYTSIFELRDGVWVEVE